jgi:hypothetical protein
MADRIQCAEHDHWFIPMRGCHTTSGCLGGHCKECDIRACGISHNVSTCAECAEFENCERIQGFFAMVPHAAENLRPCDNFKRQCGI